VVEVVVDHAGVALEDGYLESNWLEVLGLNS